MLAITKSTGQKIDVNIVELTIPGIDDIAGLKRKELVTANAKEDRWWLKSPGYISHYAAHVNKGTINYDGSYVLAERGVRPMIVFSDDTLEKGEEFQFLGNGWMVIAPGKALCESIVGETAFRADWKVQGSNDFEASDLKKWLRLWYDNALASYKKAM